MHPHSPDGAPIPSHIPVSTDRGAASFEGRFGIVRGWIERAVYPDDSDNQTGLFEYVVTIQGQEYFGVLDMFKAGGIFNNHMKVRKGVDEGSFVPTPLGANYEEKKDGEAVWCMFIDGDAELPIIIGSSQHPRVSENEDFKIPTKEDGVFERYEFNGIEFMVDKDSNLTIKHLGRKTSVANSTTPDPASDAAINPNPSQIKFMGNGDFIVDINDTLLKASFIKETGLFEVEGGDGTKFTFDGPNDSISAALVNGDTLALSPADGLQVSNPDGTSLSMKGGVLEAEGDGGKLKMGANKVGLGSGSNELLKEMSNLLQEIITYFNKEAAVAATYVATAAGPGVLDPTRVTDATAVGTNASAIKTKIDAITGGI